MLDKKALYQISSGLYLVSSKNEGHQAGCIINTLMQVTSKPVQVSITINKENDTTDTILKSNVFHVTALASNVDMNVIATFGFQSSKEIDKFQSFETKYDTLDNPYIEEGMNASFACKVVHTLDVGSHIIIVGEVVESESLSQENSMTYAYYHDVKKGTSPKNAPTYQEEIKTDKKTKWRCKICGYIYEGEELPADFICPICGQPASMFEKVED
jgi:flavin reductase (DIM6/NTAB) family NADH-FMN oxidoreductase RutF/rubredoxin